MCVLDAFQISKAVVVLGAVLVHYIAEQVWRRFITCDLWNCSHCRKQLMTYLES